MVLKITTLRHLTKMARQFSSEAQQVILKETNNKGIITLNRPKALNALNMEMVECIYPALKDWESRKLDLVILEGAGEKAFCAGGDIRAITSFPRRGTVEQCRFFAEEYKLNNLIGTLGIPFVAVIDGITMGGGVGLSVHGKYRVATEKTIFAMPETGIGLFPDVGGSYFLPRLSGELGMFLAITGHRLKGADCFHSGIATHTCQSSSCSSLINDLLELPIGCKADEINNLVLNVLKHNFDYFYLSKYDETFPKSTFTLEDKLNLINNTFSANTIDEILFNLSQIANDESHKESKWAAGLIDQVHKLSPTSVKVTLRQIREGKKMKTLADCLKMEYRLVRRFCNDTDFYEGVRALLVDRDGKPSWNPKHISDVSSDQVDKYFEHLPEAEELQL